METDSELVALYKDQLEYHREENSRLRQQLNDYLAGNMPMASTYQTALTETVRATADAAVAAAHASMEDHRHRRTTSTGTGTGAGGGVGFGAGYTAGMANASAQARAQLVTVGTQSELSGPLVERLAEERAQSLVASESHRATDAARAEASRDAATVAAAHASQLAHLRSQLHHAERELEASQRRETALQAQVAALNADGAQLAAAAAAVVDGGSPLRAAAMAESHGEGVGLGLDAQELVPGAVAAEASQGHPDVLQALHRLREQYDAAVRDLQGVFQAKEQALQERVEYLQKELQRQEEEFAATVAELSSHQVS